MTQFAAVLVLCALTQAEEDTKSPNFAPNAYELRQAILKGQYRRVGVIPRFLVREGDRETAAGSIGPKADDLADQLAVALANESQGKYRVVDSRRMRQAFKKLKIDDLGSPDALKQVAKAVDGMDALVVCVVTDERSRAGQIKVEARLVEVADCSLAGAFDGHETLWAHDAAYMGESWELRRWYGRRLKVVGLKARSQFDTDLEEEFCRPYADGGCYDAIRRDRPHPLLDPQCPFRMAVVVDGQERPLTPIGSKIYAALDPGETYWVRVENKGARPALFSLLVDGVNILGKRREHPQNAKFWYLPASYTSNLRGWYTGKEGSYSVEEFVIAPADDTVAAGQGFTQQLGMITVILSTIGFEDIPKTSRRERVGAAAPGAFGTGAGRRTEVKIEEQHRGKPGLVLAAMTIYYATSPRVEQLRKANAQ